MADRTVGDVLLELITEPNGALFGVPGGQTLPLYGATINSSTRHLVMRDERNAANAADGYARVSGKVGICDATVGPGATNLISGLAEAQASSIPVMAIVADTRRDSEHLRVHSVASQSFSQSETLSPVVKWVGRVLEPGVIPEVVGHALRVATSGRPGPVVVSIPEDIFLSRVSSEDITPLSSEDRQFPRYRPHPPPDQVEEVSRIIRTASRPLILAGGGLVLSGAAQALAELVECTNLPVVTSLNGKGSVDELSRFSGGVVGGFGSLRGNHSLHIADVVLVIGSKNSQLGSHSWRLPSREQMVIHVDIDGAEIGRAIPIDLGILADAKSFLYSLKCALKDWSGPDTPWIEPEPLSQYEQPEGQPINPALVAEVLDDLLGPSDLLVCDASLSSGWAARHFRVKSAGPNFIAPRGIGGLGWSTGAAIGARVARGDGRVAVLTGDGGLAYGLGEMETSSRYNLDITTVVLNNSSYGWIRHVEERFCIPRSSDFTEIDFSVAAQSMGLSGRRVKDPKELRPAIQDALEMPGPALVEIISCPDASPVISYTNAKNGAYS